MPVTLTCSNTVRQLVSTFKQLPNVKPGNTRHVTFCVLSTPRSRTHSLTRTVRRIGTGVHFYSVYNGIYRSDPYPMYTSPEHSHSIVYIIRRPGSIVDVRHAHRCRNLCRILNNTVGPVTGINPTSLHVPNLLGHLRNSRIGRIVVTLSPGVRNRTAADCLARLLQPMNIGIAQLTDNLPINSSLRCTSRVALNETLTNQHRT